jgi:Protein of unknown function (DUF1559)
MNQPLSALVCSAAVLVFMLIGGLGLIAEEKEPGRPAEDKGQTEAFIRSRNSLKHLMLAMHEHHDARHRLPAAYSRKEDGTKLLSWRVHLLPFLGEDVLYAQFHLDEPWDSEHNKKLIPKIPTVFISPALGDDAAKKGLTGFVGPAAPKTIFDGGEAIPFSKIRDGTSHTVAFIEVDVEHAVIWSQPGDLNVDWKAPLKGLKLWKVETGSVFLTVFCDGKVQAISDKISSADFRRLLQRNDGEAIGVIP